MFSSISFGQKDTLQSKFILLEYGFPLNENYYLARDEVSDKWDIHFKRVALCIVDEKLEDSVQTKNNITYELISLVHGEDWEKQFNEEIEKIYKDLNNQQKEKDKEKQLEMFKAMQSTEPKGAIEQPETNILFRGYPNKILPSVTNNNGLLITLVGTNCSISRLDSSDYFIIKPGKKKEATITLNLILNDSLIPIKSIQYRVVNLPAPSLYWGKTKSGKKAISSSRTIEVKYNDGIALNPNFTIIKWAIYHNGESISGVGHDLSSANSFLQNLESGKGLSINATFKGPDGRERIIGGAWEL